MAYHEVKKDYDKLAQKSMKLTQDEVEYIRREAILDASMITSGLYAYCLNEEHGFGKHRLNELNKLVYDQINLILDGDLDRDIIFSRCSRLGVKLLGEKEKIEKPKH